MSDDALELVTDANRDREDRERRNRLDCGLGAVVFTIGNLVSHDSIGDAVVLNPGRERDGFVQIEWTRVTGKHGTTIPAWAKAARIAFAFSPNSAACERVFSLLAVMFGETQASALADYLEAALMLAYNDRPLG